MTAASPISFSVIIPARNEADRLPTLISHLRATSQDFPLEIVICDGKSDDNTLAIAQTLADRAVEGTHPCRPCQMDTGAKTASGDIFVFLHADTRLPDSWQSDLAQAFQRTPPPAATAFQVKFDRDEFYYRLMSRGANWRAEKVTGIPHGDQAITVHRTNYFKVGGYPHVPLMEEYSLVRKLRKMGGVTFLPRPVTTSSRRYEKNGVILNNMRNLALIGLFYMGVPAKTLAKLYR